MAYPPLSRLAQFSVGYRHWQVAKPKAVLLLVHGLGAHSARWEFLGAFFQAHKISVWAIELPGFGEGSGPRAHVDSFQTYFREIVALTAHLRAQFPNQKIFLLGESLGGLISFRLAELHPQQWDGLILISPAFQNVMKFRVLDYCILPPALLFSPQTYLQLPFTAAMCTRDRAYQQIMENNPLELRIASAQLLFQILLEQLRSFRQIQSVSLSCLFLLAGKDHLVNPKSSQRAFQRLAAPDKKLIFYPEMFHALSIDLNREQVFGDILRWLQERL